MLITANLVVFVLVVAAAGGVGYATFQLNQIHRVHVKDLKAPTPNITVVGPKGKRVVVHSSSPPFTVLLIGSDSRAGAVHSGLDVGSTATNPESLGDSIILARVAPATHQVALLSIPRDLWVSIPGLGMGKINSAFSATDPSRLVEVVNDDLGIPVNHFAEVSFDSFEQIADAIGGVEQYFPTPAVDTYSDLDVAKAGCVLLKGPQALAFVRSRHYRYIEPGQASVEQVLPESDLARIQRQQAFIKNAVIKIKREGVLTSPVRLAKLVSSITKNLTVDQTFSDHQLISLAEDFTQIDASAIPNSTYPVKNETIDGVDALSGIPSADAAAVARFEAIGVPKAKKTSPAPTKKVPPATGTIYGSSATVEADSSSFYHGVYIPPGREPNQVVQTCGD
jgi:LCP family protein required for cell wall assembly